MSETLTKEQKRLETRRRWYLANKPLLQEKAKTPEAKQKRKDFIQKFYQDRPWYSAFVYAKRKCRDVKHVQFSKEGQLGIKFELTYKEALAIWQRDTQTGTFKKPYLQRIDLNKNYTADNVQFVEKYLEKPQTTETQSQVEEKPLDVVESQERPEESKV